MKRVIFWLTETLVMVATIVVGILMLILCLIGFTVELLPYAVEYLYYKASGFGGQPSRPSHFIDKFFNFLGAHTL